MKMRYWEIAMFKELPQEVRKGSYAKLNYSKHILEKFHSKTSWGMERYSSFKKTFANGLIKLTNMLF